MMSANAEFEFPFLSATHKGQYIHSADCVGIFFLVFYIEDINLGSFPIGGRPIVLTEFPPLVPPPPSYGFS